MGFEQRWIDWIKSFFNSMKVSILVKGSPSSEVKPCRGLRQRDPLSPLLYNLVAEVLNLMLRRANQKGLFKGIFLNKHGQDQLTHLQFADDTLLFIEGSLESVRTVKRILQCFQLLTGLRINFNKSSLYSCSKDRELVTKCANSLGCLVGEWPLKYLGAPLGTSMRRKFFWKPLIQKFEDKLTKWRSSALNKAGRSVL